jgi:ribonuclease HI
MLLHESLTYSYRFHINKHHLTEVNSPQHISLYTDGASSGNPGPGGFGVVLLAGDLRREISGGFSQTTNNRMELLAVIAGLEALKKEGSLVSVYSDSKYVVEAVNKGWLFDWEKKRFKKKKNPDLWIRFLSVYRRHRVRFVWIKGHAEIPENERCDALAVAASQLPGLPPDAGYLASLE